MSRTLGRAAIVSLALGTVTVACNPGGGHVASASGAPVPRDARAAKMADKARDALGRHDAAKAIRLAEGAVAAAPGDAGYRAILGRAYLAAGRFASAEASLAESLAIAPAAPRPAFDLALARIALGKGADARALLDGLSGKLPEADIGLALALSGDRDRAIALLSDLVRAGKSDARARQNLALAFALDGRWGEARGVAMQDTPPDRINDQIAGWATLAANNDPRAEVAAMLGATPAAIDPGRPVALALAMPPVAMPVTAAAPPPVALAAASVVPVTPIARAEPDPAQAVAYIEQLPPVVAPPVVAPAPVAVAQAAPAVPALLAAPRPARASFVRVAAASRVSPGPILRASARGGYVVQLGAFSKVDALQVAWARASRLSPHVATFSPVSGRTSLSGATLMRLSVGGFDDRARAGELCRQIRVRGGACFVRAAGNDTPWRWAGRDGGDRLAMRETRVS